MTTGARAAGSGGRRRWLLDAPEILGQNEGQAKAVDDAPHEHDPGVLKDDGVCDEPGRLPDAEQRLRFTMAQA